MIGEDLGTVPEGFRETMPDCGIWSYLVMMFERDDARLISAASTTIRPNALVTFNTHDLCDLCRLALIQRSQDEALARARSRRERRGALACAGHARQVLRQHGINANDLYSVLDFLSRTPSRLLAVSLEDLLGVIDQPNIPGTDRRASELARSACRCARRDRLRRSISRRLKAATRERSLPGGS